MVSNLILSILYFIVFAGIAVFFIILLVKLSRLIKEAENTFTIVNNDLPSIMSDSRQLMSHAEQSLNELDRTLKSINEPLSQLSNITKFGKRMMGSTLSKESFSMGESGISPEMKRILIGALSGIIITLINKFINRKK